MSPRAKKIAKVRGVARDESITWVQYLVSDTSVPRVDKYLYKYVYVERLIVLSDTSFGGQANKHIVSRRVPRECPHVGAK